jgi:hypothetical protein
MALEGAPYPGNSQPPLKGGARRRKTGRKMRKSRRSKNMNRTRRRR